MYICAVGHDKLLRNHGIQAQALTGSAPHNTAVIHRIDLALSGTLLPVCSSCTELPTSAKLINKSSVYVMSFVRRFL